MSKALSTRLDDFARVMRRYVASNQRPSVDALAGLFAALQDMAHAARALEARAKDAEEMEAVAADLDIIPYAKSGEIGGQASTSVRLARDASGQDDHSRQVSRPGAAGIDPASDPTSVDRPVHDIMTLDNTAGDGGEVIDLSEPLGRERLRREHHEAQAAIEANEQRIDALKAREGVIAGRNACGNDVLVFPTARIVRAVSTCGGPDDGDAA